MADITAEANEIKDNQAYSSKFHSKSLEVISKLRGPTKIKSGI